MNKTDWNRDIEERLQMVEKQNRQLKIIIFCCLFAVVCAITVSCEIALADSKPNNATYDEVKAKRFMLVEDRDGKEAEIGRWGYDEKSALVLSHGGNTLNYRVRLSAGDYGGVSVMSKNYSLAKLTTSPNGAAMSLIGRNSEDNAVDSTISLMTKDSRLLILDKKQNQRIDLMTGRGNLNGPLLRFQEPISKETLELGRAEEKGPYRLFYFDGGSRTPVEP